MLEINATHMPLGDVQGLRRPDGIAQAPQSEKDGGFMAILESAHAALRGSLQELDRAAWSPERSIRVLDFTGRFLDHHLETRPKSHARFLASPDRNRRTMPRSETH